MRDDVKRTFILLGMLTLAVGPIGTALAGHGALGSTQRDAWINDSLARLSASGYLPVQAVPFAQQTNLEAAENVARAAERLLAQAPELPALVDPTAQLVAPAAAAPSQAVPMAAATPVPGAKPPADLRLLVEEYRKELAALGVDMDRLQAKLKKRRNLFTKLTQEQVDALDRTGAEVGVYSRGFINGQRVFGQNLSHDGTLFNEVRFRSVPVPKLLFEMSIRYWTTLGYYFVDPGQKIEMRTITLMTINKAGTFQAGDFFRSFSSLTLWNPSDVYNLVEPRVSQWRRVDREEMVFMDKGSDWRLRGLRYANNGVKLPLSSKFETLLSWDLMGGPVKAATTGDYANYWAGARVGVGLFEKKVQLDAIGLRFWDEPQSAHIAYIDDFAKTWCQRYEIGGLNPKVDWEVNPNLTVKGEWDGATCKYHDDMVNDRRYYQDWGSILQAAVVSHGVEVRGKMFNVGPNFYNPGSQTLRYTPGAASAVGAPLGYMTSANYRDSGAIGFKDRYLFSDVSRPSFAAFDRLVESIQPYGDATPNRKGFKGGFEGKLLKKGWLHPQVWYTSAEEVEPNWVRVPHSSGVDRVLAVDQGTNTATTRSFTGLDAALQMDLAAALGYKCTIAVGAEYKKQSSDLGVAKMDADSIVGSLDLPPSILPALFVPIDLLVAAKVMDKKFYGKFNKWFKGIDFNVAYRQVKGKGQEYGLSGTTLAQYAFQPIATDLGKYSLRSFDVKRDEFLVGIRYQITKTLNVRGDWSQRTEKIEDPNAPSETRSQEWRMLYEASF